VLPRNIIFLFLLDDEKTPGPRVAGIKKFTSSGLEPVTFRLVA
jgi:hypothetical protein